jgi:HSP20 family molecular chaperone IbpA
VILAIRAGNSRLIAGGTYQQEKTNARIGTVEAISGFGTNHEQVGIALPRVFSKGSGKRRSYHGFESYVKEGNLAVRVDVPGLDPKDIEISVLHDTVTISKPERMS